jgi:hypothetical protein
LLLSPQTLIPMAGVWWCSVPGGIIPVSWARKRVSVAALRTASCTTWARILRTWPKRTGPRRSGARVNAYIHLRLKRVSCPARIRNEIPLLCHLLHPGCGDGETQPRVRRGLSLWFTLNERTSEYLCDIIRLQWIRIQPAASGHPFVSDWLDRTKWTTASIKLNLSRQAPTLRINNVFHSLS